MTTTTATPLCIKRRPRGGGGGNVEALKGGGDRPWGGSLGGHWGAGGRS